MSGFRDSGTRGGTVFEADVKGTVKKGTKFAVQYKTLERTGFEVHPENNIRFQLIVKSGDEILASVVGAGLCDVNTIVTPAIEKDAENVKVFCNLIMSEFSGRVYIAEWEMALIQNYEDWEGEFLLDDSSYASMQSDLTFDDFSFAEDDFEGVETQLPPFDVNACNANNFDVQKTTTRLHGKQ